MSTLYMDDALYRFTFLLKYLAFSNQCLDELLKQNHFLCKNSYRVEPVLYIILNEIERVIFSLFYFG